MRILPVALLGLLSAVVSLTAASAPHTIRIDPQSPGRVFEGLGALSAGASSRLLIDYPEPQRSQVLDLLFKPNFGASLQHLKVEIGGDINSTCGTEPSHVRTREEFESPRPEYADRGYEWWLMREAKRRNPRILLDVLQWGAPGWIGGPGDNRRKFYSQDNADFIVSFLQAAKQHHGLEVDFCGVWNETLRDNEWIKLLRRTLDAKGWNCVQIVASDEVHTKGWLIAKDTLADPVLMGAVHAIGVHYPRSQNTPEGLRTGKPLWSSEDGPWRGDWEGARILAKAFNRNYVVGRMTKTIIWSLVTSYFDVLPLPDSGPMRANEPWTGHFEVQPGLWALAHTSQFAQPGWRYLDSACGLLPRGGSFVTLQNPTDNVDFSVVIETMDAMAPQTVAIRCAQDSPAKLLHVWRSTQHSQFVRLADVEATDSQFTLTLQPDAVYSLTTTVGQNKGEYLPPESREFPLPYTDDFESYSPGKYARYFSDQGGVFEVTRRPEPGGQCLRQMLLHNGIDWPGHPTPEPYSLIGSLSWRNYSITCDVRVERGGSVRLGGRISCSPQTADPAHGYWLHLDTEGRWSLHSFNQVLQEGAAPFAADQWHQVELRFAGPRISASLDGTRLTEIVDHREQRGLAGVGTGWNTACFDNFTVRSLPANEVDEPVDLVRSAEVTASTEVSDQFSAGCAIDGRPDTRWSAVSRLGQEEWLQIDFRRPVRVGAIYVKQFERRIEKYRVQRWDGSRWIQIVEKTQRAMPEWTDVFSPAETSRLRLEVAGTRKGLAPSIWKIAAYDTDR